MLVEQFNKELLKSKQQLDFIFVSDNPSSETDISKIYPAIQSQIEVDEQYQISELDNTLSVLREIYQIMAKQPKQYNLSLEELYKKQEELLEILYIREQLNQETVEYKEHEGNDSEIGDALIDYSAKKMGISEQKQEKDGIWEKFKFWKRKRTISESLLRGIIKSEIEKSNIEVSTQEINQMLKKITKQKQIAYEFDVFLRDQSHKIQQIEQTIHKAQEENHKIEQYIEELNMKAKIQDNANYGFQDIFEHMKAEVILFFNDLKQIPVQEPEFYHGIVPVIVKYQNKSFKLQVPGGVAVRQFRLILRKKIEIRADEAIYLFDTKNRKLLNGQMLIGQLWMPSSNSSKLVGILDELINENSLKLEMHIINTF